MNSLPFFVGFPQWIETGFWNNLARDGQRPADKEVPRNTTLQRLILASTSPCHDSPQQRISLTLQV